MKKSILMVVLLGIAVYCTAGAVYVVKSGSADFKVWVAKSKSDADLCVYEADYKSDAKNKDQIWYFEKSKSSADFTIRIVESKSSADLKVFYVKNKSEAGWKNKSHALQGRLK